LVSFPKIRVQREVKELRNFASCFFRKVLVHDFFPTNFTNFRASECRAELVRAMPSAAENIELVKIRATYKVAII
ncbi:MAG: hypothetical protein MR299_08595, partial [Bacteroidales bacterium]|nr:hypothetical protein [Bacteroidales bacterium]